MIMWEWHPVIKHESKLAIFDDNGQVWTWARGGRPGLVWLQYLFGVWAVIVILVSTDNAERIQTALFVGLIALSWYLSRRHTECAWRVTTEGHLLVKMRRGEIKDLGLISIKRSVTKDDFKFFKSRSFYSLRFPMLQFKSKDTTVGVLGNLQCVLTVGLHLPVYIGIAYASFGWGTLSIESGYNVTAWVQLTDNSTWLITAYTPESLLRGLYHEAICEQIPALQGAVNA